MVGQIRRSKLAITLFSASFLGLFPGGAPAAIASADAGVAILLIDTDRSSGTVEKGIYGQFLEHINHSVVDGLYAEQIRGCGFEGTDYTNFWTAFGRNGRSMVADVRFGNSEKSARIVVSNGLAGIRQDRIYLERGRDYDGSIWIKPEAGTPALSLDVKDSGGKMIAEVPLKTSGTDWQEVGFSFSSRGTDPKGRIQIAARGTGAVLLDFVSLMRADVRRKGKLRPDLVQAIRDLQPPFIRWPGGSFASIYRWKDGLGPAASRKYHPNVIWGGYSDYYGFGTDEFMEFCRQVETEPLIVLSATNADRAQVQYEMDWVHYLNDPETTVWGSMRAFNGHSAPYGVKYFQIDNEPMNHGLSPEQYAEIVNIYGAELRKIAPHARIIACGQKRSNDLNWSEKIVDLAGDNFDILGCHNYEYENDNFQTGLRRIEDYLVSLRDYIRRSKHPEIKLAVLEWSLCRTYDWRSGLHTAGSLILYEKLSPDLAMTCPALLMRNTTDDPTWRAFIYHDHVSWFPGAGYVVEKLFRDHFAGRVLASTTGTFADIPNRNAFFNDISQMKPVSWRDGTIDAIASGTEDGKRLVIKAVNYGERGNTLLARIRGTNAPQKASVRLYRVRAALRDAASLLTPDRIRPIQTTIAYSRDVTLRLAPHEVVVLEIAAE